MNYKKGMTIFKAIGDDKRMQIFEMLCDGTMCACEIQERFNLSQPILSHHMKIMCDSELITTRKDGKKILYEIDCHTLDKVITFLRNAKCCRPKQ